MLKAIRLIADRKICEALEKGHLNIESWHNKPLPISNDNMVPGELRMAYKILKNAGYLPPEIETKKEIQQIEDLLATCEDERIRVKQIKKLNYLVLKLNNFCFSLKKQAYYNSCYFRMRLRTVRNFTAGICLC